MALQCALDVGSRGIKILAGQESFDGSLDIHLKLSQDVRIGTDVIELGEISDQKTQKVIETIGTYDEILEHLSIDGKRAVATSAVRIAANALDFLRNVYEATGTLIEVISGGQEIRLIAKEILRSGKIDCSGKRVGILDLGGGSTDIGIAIDGEFSGTASAEVGALRLLRNDGELDRDSIQKLDAALDRALDLFDQQPPEFVIVTGGSARALARINREYAKREGDSQISRADLKALVGEIADIPIAERQERLEIGQHRADVILPAARIFLHCLERLQTPYMHVSSCGLSKGVLRELTDDLRLVGKQSDMARARLVALNCSDRFAQNGEVAKVRSAQAGELFNTTTSLHRLPVRYRDLLEVAALVQDSGKWLGKEHYHKDSLPLILEVPFGLSSRDHRFVAALARHHRGSMPNAEKHAHIKSLHEEDRLAICKLVPLLRVATSIADLPIKSSTVRFELRANQLKVHLGTSVGSGPKGTIFLGDEGTIFRTTYGRGLMVA